ncbi:MAG: hypothetical protein HQL94_10195 [Magnetococcales bacterium]|nr:hypothetical protein [Magnetococcales bacterium]
MPVLALAGWPGCCHKYVACQTAFLLFNELDGCMMSYTTATKYTMIYRIMEIANNDMVSVVDRIDALLDLFYHCCDRFDALSLSAFAHRLAKISRGTMYALEILQDARFRLLIEVIGKKLDQFTPRNLSQTTWALTSIGFRDEVVYHMIANAARQRLSTFDHQALANMAWAFRTSGTKDPEFFCEIAQESIKKITQFDPQNLANTAWAFAETDLVYYKLFNAIAESAKEKIAEFIPCGLASIVWAFAKRNIMHESLFRLVAGEVVRKIDDFEPQSISSIAWSYALMHIQDANLFEEIERFFLFDGRRFSAHSLANIIWAFAVLFPEKENFFSKATHCTEEELHAFSDIGLVQIYHASLAVEKFCPSGIHEKCIPILDVRRNIIQKQCDFTRAVESVLSSIQVDYEQQYFFKGYTIDFMVNRGGSKYAIECDNGLHNLINRNMYSGYGGRYVLKNRVLLKNSFHTVYLSRSEFYQMADQKQWIKTRLGM